MLGFAARLKLGGHEVIGDYWPTTGSRPSGSMKSFSVEYSQLIEQYPELVLEKFEFRLLDMWEKGWLVFEFRYRW